MFFRRAKPRIFTFEDRLQSLRDAGFKTDSGAGGKTRVSRDGCAVLMSWCFQGAGKSCAESKSENVDAITSVRSGLMFMMNAAWHGS